jgi:tripartite-type tricarboxylate transporter receptor subunit TctC
MVEEDGRDSLRRQCQDQNHLARGCMGGTDKKVAAKRMSIVPARRRLLRLAAGALAIPAVMRVARAQTYPTGPVRVIVGFAAGGPTDVFARLISRWLSERLGQQFFVENRSGAATNTATEAVVHAPADGHTLLLTNAANAINATLYENLSFNFIRDIVPVAGISLNPLVMEVNPALPIATIPEFIAYAKANSGKLNFSSGGTGAPNHMAGELFKAMTGVDIIHVPYRGEAPALADLIAGRVHVMFGVIAASIAPIRAGLLRAVAVSSAKRLEALPDIPPVADFVPNYEANQWYGVGAPKNTPADIVDLLNTEITAALGDTNIRARFADLVSVAMPMTPAQCRLFIAAETEKWRNVVEFARIKPD